MSDIFYDARDERFELFGLYRPYTENRYRRLPEDVAKKTSEGVYLHHAHTAGGRLRFATDAVKLTIRVKIVETGIMYHAPALMSAGFDLYIDRPDGSVFGGVFKFDEPKFREYESSLNLPAGMKQITVNFPLYGCVGELKIGIDENARIEKHVPYKRQKPIVYYGSSITQGGCASRPGTCYEAYISRRFDCDYINLGFSGNCKGEDAITEYMAGLDMALFVSDYDHNTPSLEHLKNTHFRLYETIRSKHPDIPYIMITKPDFNFGEYDTARRQIIMTSYIKARERGDKNVYFIDGSAFFLPDERENSTVDLCHPTDLGFYRMAKVIGDVISHTGY